MSHPLYFLMSRPLFSKNVPHQNQGPNQSWINVAWIGYSTFNFMVETWQSHQFKLQRNVTCYQPDESGCPFRVPSVIWTQRSLYCTVFSNKLITLLSLNTQHPGFKTNLKNSQYVIWISCSRPWMLDCCLQMSRPLSWNGWLHVTE